mmetsp:Transcript_67006/g.157216  ORF Transcript_67006/g.157216 Transcript_67006/m.157216 type:complete len:238 (-) Transcript_67006:34-747(-)
MSSSVRSRDPVVSRCEVEAADDTQDHHRRCRQAWRSSSLAAAVGAGSGLAAAKALKFTAKVAYNTAFVTGSTAGAAIATLLLRCGRGHEGLALKDGSLLVAAAFAAETFQQVVHNKFCSLLFRCNCTWEWAGGWDNCNVHNATGPRCPWCVARASISWTTDCLPLAMMLLIFGEARARGCHLSIQLLLPVLTFLFLSTVVAFCFKLATGYPYFLTGPVHGKEERQSELFLSNITKLP